MPVGAAPAVMLTADPGPARDLTTADDGRMYPLTVWPVCPDSDEPWYLMGTDLNWHRAQVLSAQRGCPFGSAKIVLTGPPVNGGKWVA